MNIDKMENENNFVIVMVKAMVDLKNACAKNTSWRNCNLCPFEKYCDAIQHEGLSTPDLWGEDK